MIHMTSNTSMLRIFHNENFLLELFSIPYIKQIKIDEFCAHKEFVLFDYDGKFNTSILQIGNQLK